MGPPGGFLGPPGTSWGFLGASWGLLGASWGFLVGPPGASWGLLGAPGALKKHVFYDSFCVARSRGVLGGLSKGSGSAPERRLGAC